MDNARSDQLQTGIRIEILTVGWMIIEMALSIVAGIAAGSVLLTAFGIDSLIELLSGGILLWRLNVEKAGSDIDRVERAEHRAAWIVAITLALLCIYVLVSAVFGLVTHSRPESSLPGLVIAAAAVVLMPYLAVVKRRVATHIGSSALANDAVNSITCAYMAATVLLGLALNTLFGWWWADDLAALIFLVWLARETREAFEEAHEAAGEGGDTQP